MNRPSRLIAVCGTATEVGKTWVGAAVARVLREHDHTVAARKPLQSFDPADGSPTDAEVLAAATGEDPQEVCPPEGWYAVPMAPPMAADHLGRRCPGLEEVVAGITWSPGIDVGLVETVGGTRSPLAEDGDSRALVAALDVDVVLLVADAGLGTIDAVRHGLAALAPAAVIVFLNRYDDGVELHRRNRRWLAERDGMAVETEIAGLAVRLAP